jgi:hypothetical protein
VNEPKFKLYASAKCVSERAELAPIAGQCVGILHRNLRTNGTWGYTVSPDTKAGGTFECAEAELEPYERPKPSVHLPPYHLISTLIGNYLHQDLDVWHKTIADAVSAAVREADDPVQLLAEIEKLEAEPDDVVKDVLDHAAVYLWDDVTPRELLTTIKTLARLR